jgi:tetratricopeptide (TPR) repeat protein
VHAITLNQIQKLPDNSPYKLFLRGSIHLQSALVKGAFNEYLSAAWDFRNSYQEINLNERKFPNFLSHKMELGALMALIGTFPKQYEWVVNVVGLEGDFEKGVKILSDYVKNAGHEPLVEQQQAMVVYTLIQLNFGPKKEKAWTFCKDKTKDFQHNLLQCYLRAFVASKCGENDIALQALKARPTGESYEQIHYLNFLMGNCLLFQLDYSSSIWFKRYLTFSTTKGSFKEAYQKLSWIAWLQNDTSKFITYSHLMEKYTKDAGSETTLMKADLAKNIYPSMDLIKARLLFDGGYYEQANSALNQIHLYTLPSVFQKLEWEYRVARILQEEHKLSEAIVHYKKCLETGNGTNSYLVPNSCLQLGLIYEQLSYSELAKSYYKKVFTYDNFDYESSIDQKAKTNLLRLK